MKEYITYLIIVLNGWFFYELVWRNAYLFNYCSNWMDVLGAGLKEYMPYLVTVLTGWVYYELVLRNTCMIYFIIVLTGWII